MNADADMHWSDLVDQARELDAGAFPFDAPVSEDDRCAATLAACETFYGHGFPDDQLGSVDDFGHHFRVSRWTVATATDGCSELTEHGSTSEAVAWWATLEAEYDTFFAEGTSEDRCTDHGLEVCPDCGNAGTAIGPQGYYRCTRFLTCWADVD